MMRRYCLIILMLLGHFMESKSSPAGLGAGGGEEPTRVFFSKVKVGSRPPSCERKCGGCRPCGAAQVPANSDVIGEGWLGVQNANYEPEGWMCKCGSSFYDP